MIPVDLTLFLSLFNNLSVFIVLIAGYGFLSGYLKGYNPPTRQILLGLFFGLVAIGSMHVKIPVADGVFVDQRNAVVALSAAYGGPIAAFFSFVSAASYRVYLGGAGVLAGVVGVCLSAVAGLLFYRLRSHIDNALKHAVAALLMTIVILPGFLLVGDLGYGWALLKRMAFPYGSAVFVGMFLGSLLLSREVRTSRAEAAALAATQRLVGHIKNTPLGVIEWGVDFRVKQWNALQRPFLIIVKTRLSDSMRMI